MSSKKAHEVVYDDRKRLRESIREVELSASPKKGKHQGGGVLDAFSFPAFAAPLEEIAKQCHAKGEQRLKELTQDSYAQRSLCSC